MSASSSNNALKLSSRQLIDNAGASFNENDIYHIDIAEYLRELLSRPKPMRWREVSQRIMLRFIADFI